MKLYNGDCLEVMKSIKDKSIDVIITDPPYGTTSCKWDSVIDFKLMWEQLNRIIKDNGAIVLFGSEPFSSALRMSNIKNYKYDWIWEKSTISNVLNAKRMPVKNMEKIHLFNKHKYYPQGLIEVNKTTRQGGNSDNYGKRNTKPYKQKYTNYPREILKGFKSERGLHPTQKPIALMEYLIKTYTNELETVLDFTMGSGTTGVACCNTNRDFIGIELDNDYFKIAEQRIKNKL